MMTTKHLGVVALISCGLAACGGGGNDDADATLSISPSTSELLVLDGVRAEQAFTAKLVAPSGEIRDVTAETTFSIDPNLGAFAANTLSVGAAGKSLAYGTWHDKTASAEVIARVRSTRVVSPLPPNTPDLFGGPEDPTKAPHLVYPAEALVVPRNLGDFEVHWTDGNGNDVFEVSLTTEFADVRVYVAGNNGVAAAGPRPSWAAFAAAEWIQAVGTETVVQYQVRGANTANPTYVATAAKQTARISNEPMEGGLYYWGTLPVENNGVKGIFRHDMAKPGQAAEEFMTTKQTAGRCVACHVLSRDGRRMAITYDGGDKPATTVDVSTGTARPAVASWNFATYTPDGSRLLTVFQGELSVRDPDSMAVLATMPHGAGQVTHPDLSPDGTRLVYVLKPVTMPPTADWNFPSGKLYTRTYDPVTQAFGTETPLVVDGENNYYPSWSPDGLWIMFNRGDNLVDGAYDNRNASLWVVKSDGGTAIQLAAANFAPGGLTNSWGRWAPFAQTVGPDHDPIFWITVSSKRDFGVRRLNSAEVDEKKKTPQIWMAPFFTARAAAGQDPSAAAFRLPFQNLTSNNHIAQWTERVVLTQ